jgi:nicotinate phosphoribosyltransferase
MIITSLLDTDFYKLTMQQCVFHRFTDVKVEYAFKCRNLHSEALLPYKDDIEQEINDLCTLRFQEDELNYLNQFPFFSEGYIEFLRIFNLNRQFVKVFEKEEELKIQITGTWLNTILFETPILAIISQLYSQGKGDMNEGRNRLVEKTNILQRYEKPFQFVDFGTRRRYSVEWQNHVIAYMKKSVPRKFIGTSNIMFAKQHQITPIGTMAHEYIQAMQSLVRLSDSQKYAFQMWADEYRGRLGIALSDTLGMDAFFRDFDLYFSKLFDGARHDSGDPFLWCTKLIRHYEEKGINPRLKTAVFSDGLTPAKAIEINNSFSNHINCSFGIGTNLTNDMGFQVPNIVIKMTHCDGRPVAKISDSTGKQMCTDEEYLHYLASVFRIPEERLREDAISTSSVHIAS